MFGLISLARVAVGVAALALPLAGCGANFRAASLDTARTQEGASVRFVPRAPEGTARPSLLENTLYSFAGGADGALPEAPLIADKSGALYSTTYGGGIGGGTSGNGTVFKLTPSGSAYTESVLYSFQGGSDGVHSVAGLFADAKGALYGTAGGGNDGAGIVFKLTPTGSSYTERVLYSFTGGNDGSAPGAGSLIADADNALYGTTEFGGSAGKGTVFKLRPSNGVYAERVLHSFLNGSDGGYPFAGLIADKNGVLYGTTDFGGLHRYGTVFKLVPKGSRYTETVLHDFTLSDGYYPTASLIEDAKGTLYGTTQYGGSFVGGECYAYTEFRYGCGTVFRLTRSRTGYTYSVLYDFMTPPDAAAPQGGLIEDKNGALYGTTRLGGTGVCSGLGCGTVFKLTPSGSGYTESVLYSFQDGADGGLPYVGLLADAKGALYGTAAGGGAGCSGGCGTVFKITP